MGYLVYGVGPRGTRGRRGRRGGHHDLFLFKHAKRPCKLAPGHVMVVRHLPLLRDGRRADQVLQNLLFACLQVVINFLDDEMVQLNLKGK